MKGRTILTPPFPLSLLTLVLATTLPFTLALPIADASTSIESLSSFSLPVGARYVSVVELERMGESLSPKQYHTRVRRTSFPPNGESQGERRDVVDDIISQLTGGNDELIQQLNGNNQNKNKHNWNGNGNGNNGNGGNGNGGAKIIIEATETIVAGGAAATAAGNVNNALKLVMVYESINSLQTSEGTVTTKCLTPVTDSSQQFCETLLDGDVIGNDGGLAVPSSTAAAAATGTRSTASSSAATTSTGTTSTTATADTTTITFAATESTTSATADTAAVAAAASTSASDSATPTASVTDSASVTATESVSDTATASTTDTAAFDSVSAASTTDTIDTTATAAEAAASASTSVYVVPGQQLQVLPIGLGIFGGLAGITLIIVGYVTYQRRNYKKQFRTRKSAEKGAPMGMAAGGSYGSA